MYWITGLLGLALGVSPWVFQYTNENSAMWTSVIVGAVVVVVSLYKALMRDNTQYWEYWIAGLAGLVAIAAPFVLGFTALTAALWTCIAIGVVVAVVSGYEVFFVQPEAI
jgi:hypothetical protein